MNDAAVAFKLGCIAEQNTCVCFPGRGVNITRIRWGGSARRKRSGIERPALAGKRCRSALAVKEQTGQRRAERAAQNYPHDNNLERDPHFAAP
jgi:hypothetical protein